MNSCSPLITFLFAYIVAFIYIREPNYKFIGYIMLCVVYIFSALSFIKHRDLYLSLLSNPIHLKGVSLVLFVIVFVSLFSLIKIIDAYYKQASKIKSFDLKLNNNYKTQLATYEYTFIIGNIAIALGLLLASYGKLIVPMLYISILIPFICIWFQLSSSIRFSKIKND